jgi:Ribosome recycling factor
MPLEKIYADCAESMKKAFSYALQELSMLNIGSGTAHLSGEQRLQLMEQAGRISENCKVRVRNARRDAFEQFRNYQRLNQDRAGYPPFGQMHPFEKRIQTLTEHFSNEIEGRCGAIVDGLRESAPRNAIEEAFEQRMADDEKRNTRNCASCGTSLVAHGFVSLCADCQNIALKKSLRKNTLWGRLFD